MIYYSPVIEMQRLKDIKLAEEELSYYKQQYFDFGSESIIVRSHPDRIYKIWNDDIPIQIRENKLKKIIAYYQKQIKYIPQITATLSSHGICSGYEMSFSEEDDVLLIAPIEKKERKEILQRGKEILSYFIREGIIYGDIKNDNILYNKRTKKLKFCDFDNTKYQDLPMDLQPEELSDFIKKYGSEDEKIHAYMYNLLTLQQLDSRDCCNIEVLQGIYEDNYCEIVDEKGKVLLKEMKSINQNYSGEYLIDHIVK